VNAASEEVDVFIYLTSWCPACRVAVAWLRRSGIRYTAYDVEANERNSLEYRRLNPRGGVPTFRIGDRVLVGFSAQEVSAAILTAAGR
jgi:glutaredoxin